MCFRCLAQQLIQWLLSITTALLQPHDNDNGRRSAQLHHQSPPQQRAKPSYRSDLSAQLPSHWPDGNIVMIATQDGSTIESATNTWFAAIKIQAHDLPRAMRDGLHWTDSNIDRAAGYIIDSPRAVISPMIPSHITCARVYMFRDISRAEPLWTAQMTVLCPDIKSATKFSFGHLRLDQITVCQAWNQGGKDVYNFQREDGSNNFNIIYDDMPLEGWWPWPKRSDSNEADLLL